MGVGQTAQRGIVADAAVREILGQQYVREAQLAKIAAEIFRLGDLAVVVGPLPIHAFPRNTALEVKGPIILAEQVRFRTEYGIHHFGRRPDGLVAAEIFLSTLQAQGHGQLIVATDQRHGGIGCKDAGERDAHDKPGKGRKALCFDPYPNHGHGHEWDRRKQETDVLSEQKPDHAIYRRRGQQSPQAPQSPHNQQAGNGRQKEHPQLMPTPSKPLGLHGNVPCSRGHAQRAAPQR